VSSIAARRCQQPGRRHLSLGYALADGAGALVERGREIGGGSPRPLAPTTRSVATSRRARNPFERCPGETRQVNSATWRAHPHRNHQSTLPVSVQAACDGRTRSDERVGEALEEGGKGRSMKRRAIARSRWYRRRGRRPCGLRVGTRLVGPGQYLTSDRDEGDVSAQAVATGSIRPSVVRLAFGADPPSSPLSSSTSIASTSAVTWVARRECKGRSDRREGRHVATASHRAPTSNWSSPRQPGCGEGRLSVDSGNRRTTR